MSEQLTSGSLTMSGTLQAFVRDLPTQTLSLLEPFQQAIAADADLRPKRISRTE